MQITKLLKTGKNYNYRWPDGSKEKYAYWIDYNTKSEDGDHHVKVGFGKRWAFGKDRLRVVVRIDIPTLNSLAPTISNSRVI
jgi:hypothetical protein